MHASNQKSAAMTLWSVHAPSSSAHAAPSHSLACMDDDDDDDDRVALHQPTVSSAGSSRLQPDLRYAPGSLLRAELGSVTCWIVGHLTISCQKLPLANWPVQVRQFSEGFRGLLLDRDAKKRDVNRPASQLPAAICCCWEDGGELWQCTRHG